MQTARHQQKRDHIRFARTIGRPFHDPCVADAHTNMQTNQSVNTYLVPKDKAEAWHESQLATWLVHYQK